jgi:hypothetical protein
MRAGHIELNSDLMVLGCSPQVMQGDCNMIGASEDAQYVE